MKPPRKPVLWAGFLVSPLAVRLMSGWSPAGADQVSAYYLLSYYLGDAQGESLTAKIHASARNARVRVIVVADLQSWCYLCWEITEIRYEHQIYPKSFLSQFVS